MGVTLRQVKGADLTPNEADANFILLGGGIGPTTVVISNGVINLTGLRGGWYRVDTEDGAATDDVHTVTGLTLGDTVRFMAANDAHHVRFLKQSGGGNLWLNPPEFTLNNTRDHITMFWDGSAALEDHRMSLD